MKSLEVSKHTSQTDQLQVESIIDKLMLPAGYEVSGYREELLEQLVEDDQTFHAAIKLLKENDQYSFDIKQSLLAEITQKGADKFREELLIREEIASPDAAAGTSTDVFKRYFNQGAAYVNQASHEGRLKVVAQELGKYDLVDVNLGEFLRLSSQEYAASRMLFCVVGGFGAQDAKNPTPSACHLALAIARGELTLSDMEQALNLQDVDFAKINVAIANITHLMSEYRSIWTSAFVNQFTTEVAPTEEVLVKVQRLTHSAERLEGVEEMNPQEVQMLCQEFAHAAFWKDSASSFETVRAQERFFTLYRERAGSRHAALTEWVGGLQNVISFSSDSMETQLLYKEDVSGNFLIGRELRNCLKDPQAHEQTLLLMASICLHDISSNYPNYLKAQTSRELLAALGAAEISREQLIAAFSTCADETQASFAMDIIDSFSEVLKTGLSLPKEIFTQASQGKTRSPLEETISQCAVNALITARNELGVIVNEEDILPISTGLRTLFAKQCRGRLDLFCRYGEPLIDAKAMEHCLTQSGLNAKSLEVLTLAIVLNHLAQRIPAELRDDYYPLCALLLVNQGERLDRFEKWGHIVKHPSVLDTTLPIKDLAKMPQQNSWVTLAQKEKQLSVAIGPTGSVVKSFSMIRGMLDVLPPGQWDVTLEKFREHVAKFGGGDRIVYQLVELIKLDPSNAVEILERGLVSLRVAADKTTVPDTLALILSIGRRAQPNAFHLLSEGFASLGNVFFSTTSKSILHTINAVSKNYQGSTGDLLLRGISPFVRHESTKNTSLDEKIAMIQGVLKYALEIGPSAKIADRVQDGVLYCLEPFQKHAMKPTPEQVLGLLRIGELLGNRGSETLKNDVSWFIASHRFDISKVIQDIEYLSATYGDSLASALNSARLYLSKEQNHSWSVSSAIIEQFAKVAQKRGQDFLWGSFEDLLLAQEPFPNIEQVSQLSQLAVDLPLEATQIFSVHLPAAQKLLGKAKFNTYIPQIIELCRADQGKGLELFAPLVIPVLEIYESSTDKAMLKALSNWIATSGASRVSTAVDAFIECVEECQGADGVTVIEGLTQVAMHSGEYDTKALRDEVLTYIKISQNAPNALEFATIAQILKAPSAIESRALSDGVGPIVAEFSDMMTPQVWNELSGAVTQYGKLATELLWYAVRPFVARTKESLTAEELRQMIELSYKVFQAAAVDLDQLGENIVLPACSVGSSKDFFANMESVLLRLQRLQAKVGEGKVINQYRLAAEFDLPLLR